MKDNKLIAEFAEFNRAMLNIEINNLKTENQMKYCKTRDVKSPTRGHYRDAGIDFFVPNDFLETTIKPGRQLIIDSGVKIDVPEGYALVAFNKSGIATKKQLLVGACVVDHGYQGSIHLNVHNVGTLEQLVEPGEKLVQFILLPLGDPSLELVEEDKLFTSNSERGDGKFGSTGSH
jgi:dUTP pyrophosphatase